MKTLPEINIGTRRATRAEVFGRGKGRSRRLPAFEVIGGRWDDGVKTELQKRGKRFVVETVSEDFRAKTTFGSYRDAMDWFHAED